MARTRRTTANTFTMSFLDMVSAGFGAAFFLFLIFASLPITPSAGMMGSTEYIDLELRWQSQEHLLELVVYPPNGKELRLGTPEIAVDTLSGQVLLGTARNPIFDKAWQGAFITGSSAYGDTSLENGGWNALHFRVVNPCEGEWKFAFNVNNFRSSQLYLNDAGKPAPFDIQLKAYTAADAETQNIYTAEIKGFDSKKNLEDFINNPGKANTFTPIEWKKPDSQHYDAVSVTEPPVAVSLAHCNN